MRLAFELEHLARNLRAAGYDSEANGVAAIASQAGDIGRGLNEKLYALAYQHHRGTKAALERGDASKAGES
jgi:hypothetical protein